MRLPARLKSWTSTLSACSNNKISFISSCENKYAKNRIQRPAKTGLGRETPTALGSRGMRGRFT